MQWHNIRTDKWVNWTYEEVKHVAELHAKGRSIGWITDSLNTVNWTRHRGEKGFPGFNDVLLLVGAIDELMSTTKLGDLIPEKLGVKPAEHES